MALRLSAAIPGSQLQSFASPSISALTGDGRLNLVPCACQAASCSLALLSVLRALQTTTIVTSFFQEEHGLRRNTPGLLLDLTRNHLAKMHTDFSNHTGELCIKLLLNVSKKRFKTEQQHHLGAVYITQTSSLLAAIPVTLFVSSPRQITHAPAIEKRPARQLHRKTLQNAWRQGLRFIERRGSISGNKSKAKDHDPAWFLGVAEERMETPGPQSRQPYTPKEPKGAGSRCHFC